MHSPQHAQLFMHTIYSYGFSHGRNGEKAEARKVICVCGVAKIRWMGKLQKFKLMKN